MCLGLRARYYSVSNRSRPVSAGMSPLGEVKREASIDLVDGLYGRFRNLGTPVWETL